MLQKRIIKKGLKPTQRDLQKLRTHERIYDAAKLLFVTKGYFETRSSDIAKLAGVSHGSVFSHFKSKSEILEHLHNEFLESQIREIEAQSLEGVSTRGRLIFLLDLLWASSIQNIKLSKAMFAQGWLWDEAREETYQQLTGRLRRIGEKILREGKQKGEVRGGLDVAAAMNSLQAQYKESLRIAFRGPNCEAEGKKQLYQFIDIICSG